MQINGQIRDREVRLLSSSGQQLGVVPTAQAQRTADDEGLDLVKISPTAVPPVCKIMDYNKYRYEQAKREKENKKNQKIVEVKEIRLSMTIDENDINTKIKAATKFLQEGDKVKFSLRMRGRQMAYMSSGIAVMRSVYERLSSIAKMEKEPLAEGRSISMMLTPQPQTTKS